MTKATPSLITLRVLRFTSYVSRPSLGLTLIVLAYLVIAVQYAARTPNWQVPDEPAHYNYVRFIVEHGALPVLRPGDYDQTFLEQFTHPQNTPHLPIEPLRYEFWQPPLYYLLAAPIYALTGGSLLALRLFSVALGGALIVVAFLVVRETHPHMPMLALGTAAFVAFIPQHVAMLAGVNNDSLAELLLALTLLQTFRISKPWPSQWTGVKPLGGSGRPLPPANPKGGLRTASTPFHRRGLLTLGVLLGLGLLTKGTNYLMLPIVFVALMLSVTYHVSRVTSHVSRITYYASRFILVLLPALVLGSLWWLHNISVYGGFDILGLANHNAVVVGQPLTSDWIARMGFGPFLMSAVTTTFHSFWGQFGWMGVPMPDTFYLALGALSIIAFLGWLWSLRETPRPLPHSHALFLLLVLLSFGYYIFYNFTFVQHQGRYLFTALIPLGLIFSIGIERWTRLLPRPIRTLVCAGVFAALAALDVWALYRFVIPALAV